MVKQSTGRSEYQPYDIEHRADYYKGTRAEHIFFFHYKSPMGEKRFRLSIESRFRKNFLKKLTY